MKILFNTLITRNNLNNQKAKKQSLVFKGFECPEDSFELKNLYNLPCPVCAVPMIKRNQKDEFVNSVQNKTGDSLISTIQKYQKYFHDIESQAAEVIIQEAKRNPNENIQQIVDRMANSNQVDLREEQITKLEEARKFANNNGLSSQEQKAFNAVIDEYMSKIILGDTKVNFDELMEKISPIIKKSIAVRKRVLKHIAKIPKEENGAEKFFKKYSGKTQAEIASRLVLPAFITCEHIVPKASGGTNNTENYLAQCQECNSTRGDKPFQEWTVGIPMFERNFRNYLDIIAKKLESGEISPKYDTYLADVANTVRRETKGRINVKPPQVSISSSQDEELDFEEYLTRFKEKLQEEKEQTQVLEEKARQDEQDPQFSLVVKYNVLKTQQGNLNRNIRVQEKTTTNKKEILDRCYKKINELEEAKAKIAPLSQTDKIYNELRTKISRIEGFLSSKNIQEIEQQYEEAKRILEELKAKRTQNAAELAELEKQIVFPAQIQQQINAKKAYVAQISELYRKERALVKEDNLDSLIIEAQTQEAQLAELASANTRINTSSSTGKEIIKYRHLLTLVDRIQVIRGVYEAATKGKTQIQEDAEVFDYAKDKIEEEINDLVQNKPSVQYQINLDRIMQITQNLQKLYAEIEKTRKQREEQEELQVKIGQSALEIEEAKSEIEFLTQQYNQALSIFESAGIDASIETNKQRIQRKEQLLEDLQNDRISQEEFMQESTTI